MTTKDSGVILKSVSFRTEKGKYIAIVPRLRLILEASVSVRWKKFKLYEIPYWKFIKLISEARVESLPAFYAFQEYAAQTTIIFYPLPSDKFTIDIFGEFNK